jgi:hypothetical protein
VVRVVEYVVVRDKIHEIAEFYSPIGILHSIGGHAADVSVGADIVANSRFEVVEDRRRGFEGTLEGMQNRYVMGSHYHFVNRWLNLHPTPPRHSISSDHRTIHASIDYHLNKLEPRPGFAGFVNTDAFFYGELIDMWHVYDSGHDSDLFIVWDHYSPEQVAELPWYDFRSTRAPFYPHVGLLIYVDSVLAGYPEHVSEGVTLALRYYFDENMASPFESMEIGQRYFLRGTFYYLMMGINAYSGIPGADTRDRHMMEIKPLNDYGLWYVPVSAGETVDSSTPGLANLDDELAMLRHAQSSVYLRTTRNMHDLLITQSGENEILTISSGRMLDEDDHLYARPVAVIQEHFARERGLQLGDTFVVNVNREQHLVLSPYRLLGDGLSPGFDYEMWQRYNGQHMDLGVLSKLGAYPAYRLELEVVGMFDLFSGVFPTSGHPVSKLVFIPDSLLPADLVLQSAYFGDIGTDFLPAAWYSFVLSDVREQNAFLAEYHQHLAEMGFNLFFIGHDATNFWVTANIIISSMALNLLIFSFLLIMVLVLVVFLCLWQRRKELPITRVLGNSAENVAGQYLISVLLITIPAILIGVTTAWHFSTNVIADVLSPFHALLDDVIGGFAWQREQIIASHLEASLPSIMLPIALSAAILVAMLLFTILGLAKTLRRPVLEMLQLGRR